MEALLLHESFLFDGNGDLLPGIDRLLFRLQHSKLHIGITVSGFQSVVKEASKRHLGEIYAMKLINFESSHPEIALKEAHSMWGVSCSSCIFVTAQTEETTLSKIVSEGWAVVIQDKRDMISKLPGMVAICSPQDLFIALSRRNKLLLGGSIITVGYTMKWSREKDFLKRGAFPIIPTPNGLTFVSIHLNEPLQTQLETVNIVLHKVTDEISSVNSDHASCLSENISFSEGMKQLERLVMHMNLFMIDPFENIIPLLDRSATQEILQELVEENRAEGFRVRPPHFIKVSSFCDSNLERRLSEARLALPTIVKPRIACGVEDAHKMAVVFKMDEFCNLPVPVPAVIQEYIDHGSVVFKFYVLGKQVFYAVRNSTPNATSLLRLSNVQSSSAIVFDSLKSLPVDSSSNLEADFKFPKLDLGAITKAAMWLRKRLHLTIFGFDVVMQAGTGDHVIIDVNYLPSFKEIENDTAIPAFWEAIKNSYLSHLTEVSLSEVQNSDNII